MRIARLVVVSVIAVGVVMVPTALSNRVHGQAGCSDATLSGPYGIEGSGSLGGLPAGFVGTLVFDGQGKVSGPVVLNVGGTIDPFPTTSTYRVNAGCDGLIYMHTPHTNPPRSHFHDINIAVVDGGRRAFLVVGGPKNSPSETPPPGEILMGELSRQ
jgi:hypothetical protein